MKNIKQNRLSLKSLQTELEQLKIKSGGQSGGIPTQSRLSSLGLLWIITFIISWAHKIPIISKFIKVLSLWYGRTTWWKIFASIRKAFIVFNAIIGIMTILETIGGEITIYAIKNMFDAYLDKLKSFGLNILNWIGEKVGLYPTTPNINFPTNTGGGQYGGFTKEQIERINDIKRQRAALEKVLNKIEDYPQSRTMTSWFSWLSGSGDSWIPNWLWYGGLTILGVGVLYLGYKLITDPYNIASQVSSNKPKTMNPDIIINDASNAESSGAAKAAAEALDGVGEAIGNSFFSWFTPVAGIKYITNNVIGGAASGIKRNVIDVINPFNWTKTHGGEAERESFHDFMEDQDAMSAHSNKKLYPYTPDNPYDSWFTRIRKALRGETQYEMSERINLEEQAWDKYNEVIRSKFKGKGRADLPYDTLRIEYPEKYESNFPSGVQTPNVATNLGLNPEFTADNTIQEVTRVLNASYKLKNASVEQDLQNVWSENNPTAGPSNVEKDLDSPTNQQADLNTEKPSANLEANNQSATSDLDDNNNSDNDRAAEIWSDEETRSVASDQNTVQNHNLTPNEPTLEVPRVRRHVVPGEDPGAYPRSPFEEESGILGIILALFN